MRVCFIFSSSPSPPLYRPTYLFLPVFLTFPTLVVPVHSIRLEYGCVVVDTCTVWSVSQCCRVMICCSSWCHRTRSSDQISGHKGERGDPGSLKKHWFPFHTQLIPEETFLELSRSAQCHSGMILRIWKPMDCTVCIFSDDILSHFSLQV